MMRGNFITARHFQPKNERTIFGGVPERTVISAPFGNVAGAGPHSSSLELSGIFISSAMAVLAPARTKAKTVNRRDITISFFGEASSCASGEPSQLMFKF